MSAQPKTLEERIAAALRPGTTITSVDVAAVIKEVETVIAKADQMAASHDPGVSDQAMTATLAANRLSMSLPKLQDRYQQMHEREQAVAWRAEREKEWLAKHDVLKPERDALAEEWREVYPAAAGKIADLIVRTAANNEALAELHRDRPAGMEQHLVSAELYACARTSFSRDTPSLLGSVHLFDWHTGRQICPPQRPSLAAAFAATSMVPAYNPADWANNCERRTGAKEAERRLMADYYARTTREQEERENREARERFAESQRKRR